MTAEIATEQNSFMHYSLQDNVMAELHNNLIIVDALVGNMHLSEPPKFFILGGAAMIFYELMDRMTLDIDVVNTIDEAVKEEVSAFISDQASTVAQLGKGYESRMVPYARYLRNIEVYLLSQEDIIITKMMSNRRKDVSDLINSEILTAENEEKVKLVLEQEYPTYAAEHLNKYMHRLVERRQKAFD